MAPHSDTKSQYYRWVLTLDQSVHPIDEGVLGTILIRDIDSKAYVFQLEKGEVAGRVHYQGRFTLRFRKVKSTLLKAFKEAFKYHTKSTDAQAAEWLTMLTLQPERNEKDATRYSEKNETRVNGPWYFPPKYVGQDLYLDQIEDAKYAWQEDLLDYWRKNKESARKICYIYDPDGNSGKSIFIKRQIFQRSDDVAILTNMFSPPALTAALIELGPKGLYLADLPRANGKASLDLLSVCEQIKNGVLVSTIYGAHKQLIFNPPIVTIFSNDLPDFNALSKDRWAPFKITKREDGSTYLFPILVA